MEATTYLATLMFPSWLPEDAIAQFRRRYDPMVHLEPHITLIFPIPTWELDRQVFVEHVRTVVSGTASFDIRLNALEKSWDHWLFLVPTEGRAQVIELHDELYTGLLRPFLWTEHPYVPHIGLGLFAETSDGEDLHELLARSGPLDPARYGRGLREAEALELDYTGPFESVHVVEIPEDLSHMTRLEEVRMRDR